MTVFYIKLFIATKERERERGEREKEFIMLYVQRMTATLH